MSNQIVKSSTRLWSQEVAEVRASEEMDRSVPGADGIARLTDTKEPGYEFSNGRKFATKRNPYA